MYNETFINMYKEERYLKILGSPSQLDVLANGYTRKYKESDVDGYILAFKESLDHYVLKRISEDNNFVKTPEFRNYFNYIKKIIKEIPTELATNLVLCNIDILRTASEIYEPNDQNAFAYYLRYQKSMNKRVDNLNKKIKNNILLTQDEINFLCSYYAGRRKYDENYSNLITYIFTYFGKQYGLKCSYEVLDAIFTYLPFEYNPEEIKEVSLGSKFESKSVRIFFTDIRNGKKWDGPGVSTKNSIVFMNRKMFKDVNFDSIDDSRRAYLKKGKDFTFMMIVAYHELTHQLQDAKSRASNLTKQGVMSAMKNIINGELCDYKNNHDNDDIEIDATDVGWRVCRSFFIKHYQRGDKEKLSSNCYVNSNSTKTRYGTAIKTFDDGRIMEKDIYDVSILTRIISKCPKILGYYPCLKKIYSSDGSINQNILFSQNFGFQLYGRKYMLYLLRNGELNNISFDGISDYDLLHFLENIHQAVVNSHRTMQLIDYTDRHNNDGEQKKVIDDEKVKDAILKNSFEDFYNAIKIYRKFSNNDQLKSTVKFYVKDLRNCILSDFSDKVSLLNGMKELSIDEQIDLLGEVVKKAREIGVSEECIKYFDNRRIKLKEMKNNNQRANIM